MTTPDPSADPNFDGLFNYADLAGAVAAVPELRTQPSLATSVAQSGPGAVGTAQALVGTVNQANASQVVQRAHHDGLLGHLAHAIGAIRDGIERVPYLGTAVHAAGTATGTVLGWANAPLGDVQHNYRFVRDVFDAHGVAAGVGELLAASVGGIAGGVAGFVGGAAAGAAAGGITAIPGAFAGAFAGAKIGSEGVLSLAAKYGPYQDSWARTQNGDSYQLHGHTVSLGRDVANAIGLPQGVNHTLASITDSIPIIGTVLHGLGVSGDPYRAVSGAVDGAADVGADPLLAASSLSKLNRARTIITSPKDFERLALNPPARFSRMVNDVAGSNTGQIIEHYPTLAPYAPQLAKASTPDEVIDVLRTNLNAADGLIGTRTIPSYTITRVPFRKIADSLRDAAPQETTGLSPAEMAAILPTQGIRTLTAKITNSLSNRTPFALDPDTKELLSTGWDVDNPRALEVLYSTALLHQSRDYARAIAARFGSTDDPAAKYQIWDEVHASTVAAALAKHGVTDPKVAERVTAELKDQSAAAGGGRDGQYSMRIQSNPVTGDLEWVPNDRIPVGDGATAPSATWETQAGKLYTYNWSTLNSVARQFGAVSKYYGAVDDGMYKYFMKPVFKPGNLLTLGFALRNAGNELMTGVIKNGGLNLVRSFVAKTGAKLDYKYLGASPTVPDEIDHVTAALAESVGPEQALKDAKSKAALTRTEVATRLLTDGDGHMLPGALDAAHHSQEFGGDNLTGLKDQTSKIIASVTGRGDGERLGPNFVQYTNGDGHKYAHALSGALAMAVRDPSTPLIAQAYRAALPAGDVAVAWNAAYRAQAVAAARDAALDWLRSDKGAFQRSLLKGAQTAAVGHDGMDPLLSFATRRAESVEALAYGENGQLNRNILDGLADHNAQIDGRTAGGLHPNLHPDVLNAQDTNSLPARVPGMEIVPTQDIGLQRLVNKGFSVLGGIINRLSRDPMYVNHVFEEYKLTSATPGLSDEEAWHLAQTRAIERMVPEIHNPQDRSQFALAARNYIPFLFAREQAYKRLGQALATNPAGFRGPQLVGHALKNIGWVTTQTGPDGKPQDTFNYPLSGPIGEGVNKFLYDHFDVRTAVGIPTGFRGSITGLAAGGEAPGSLTGIGWSPILSIPVRALASLDPGAQQFVESIEGPVAAGQSNYAEVIPNAPLRSFLTGATSGWLAQRTFTNAMIDSIQYAMANGDIPPNPYKPDGRTPDPAFNHWMEKFTTRNRILFGIKAIFGVGAPSSPIMKQGSNLLQPLAKQYIDKYGKSEGMQRLFQDHPNITPYEVFRSAPNSALPDSQKALQWATQNRSFIDTYGKAATFFAPQPASGNANDAAVRNAEYGLGLRERRAPDEYVQEVVAQTGWNLYQQAKAARDAAIAAHPGDDQYASDQASNFRGYVQNVLGRLNPTWYSQYSNMDANVEQQRNLVEQTRAILNRGLYPPGSDGSVAILRSLMGSYDAHMQALALTGGNSSLYTTRAARDERTNYQTFLTGFAAQHPEATIIINRLFKGA